MFLNLPKKIIGDKNLSQDVYALKAGQSYLFKIPIKIINYDSNKVKKIKLSFINEEKFLNVFNSSIFSSSEVENQKSFGYNDFYESLLNDSFLKTVHKSYNNVMTDIGDGDNIIYQTSNFNADNITKLQFDSVAQENNSSYLDELSNIDSSFVFSTIDTSYSDSYYYVFSLSSEKSIQIVENRSFFVRIAILDDYDNIVDHTQFSYVDFENIVTNNARSNFSSYINTELFNMGVPDTLDIMINSEQSLTGETAFYPEISIQGFLSSVKILNLNEITDIKLDLSYFTESLGEVNSIMITHNFGLDFINENNNFKLNNSNDARGYTEFLNSLIYDYYFLEKQEYVFDLQISVNYLSTDESLQSVYFSHQVLKSRIDSIFSVLINRNNLVCSAFFTNILNNFDFSHEYEKSGNFIKATLTLDSEENNQNIKRKIFVKEINQNNNLLENIFNDETELLSNKINYRDKNLMEIFETFGSFTFFNRLSTDNFVFNYLIGYRDDFLRGINKSYVSRNLYFPRSVVTRKKLNKVNFLFSKNLSISAIEKNLELDSFGKQSFVKYETFELNNISNFSELAYDYGYVDGNSLGDPVRFLKNCIILVENITQVKEFNIKSVRSNIFYFNDFFQENFVIVNNEQTTEKFFISNQSIDLNTPDIERLNQTNNNTRALDLFKTCIENQDVSLKIRNIKRLKNINKNISVKNKIEIVVMPVPEIVSRFKGYGLDSDGNPIDTVLYDTVTESDRTLLSKSFYDLFYSTEQSLSKSLFDSYVSNFMNPELSSNVSNFYKMFLQTTKRKITNNSFFKKKNKINLNEYLQFLEENNDIQTVNSNNIMLSFKQNSFEENIHNRFFKQINYKIDKNINFPYKFVFNNLQRQPNLERQEAQDNNSLNKKQIYNFTSKNFLFNDLQDNVSFNISSLTDIYNVGDILNNTVFKVRSCPILLLTNFQEMITEENKTLIESLQKGYSVINYDNSDCVVYNYDYVRDASRRTSFNQYLNNSFFDQKYSIDTFSNKVIFNIQSGCFRNSYVKQSDLKDFIQDCESYNIKYIKNIINRVAISIQIRNSVDQFVDYYTLFYNIPLNSSINKLNDNIIYDISYMTNIQSRIVSSNT